METKELIAFKKQRAIYLAAVILTRSDDFKVYKDVSGSTDLQVEINSNEKLGASFYVITHLVNALDNLSLSLKLPTFQHNKYEHFLHPLCEIIFDEQKNQAYYQWIQRPINKRELFFNIVPDLKILDDSSLQAIKKTVLDWYSN